jgi:hypothetical protein
MKPWMLIVAVAAIAVGLVVFKPFGDKRYDKTPAGQEAKRVDTHVENAKNWRPPNTWEAREMLNQPRGPKVPAPDLGPMGEGEAKTFVKNLYDAGATEVAFLNIKRSVRFGDAPEGLYAALPDDPAARDAVFAVATKWWKQNNQDVPPDVRQKYLYFGFGGWNPKDPEPGFFTVEGESQEEE